MLWRQLRPRSSRRGPQVRALALALLVAALAGCEAGPHAATTPTPPPKPTATAAPRILYQADWSSRASEWTLPPHWSIVGGKLQNDGVGGIGAAPLTVPYQVTQANYTVTIQARVIAVKGPGVCGNTYGLTSQSPSGQPLYTSVVECFDHQLHGFSIVYAAQVAETAPNGSANTADYTPGINPQLYVTQVEGAYVSYSPSSYIGTAKSAVPLAPARLTLIDQGVRMEIERLTITTP